VPVWYANRLVGTKQLALSATLACLGVLQVWTSMFVVGQSTLGTYGGANAAFLAPTVIEDDFVLSPWLHQ